MRKIQDSIDDAMLDVLGFPNRKALLDNVPEHKRLPEGRSERELLNHAFAHAMGFNTVQDMVDAQGMRGVKHSFKA